jgi:hypothetical protein
MILRKSVGPALVVVGAALLAAALACFFAAKINAAYYANHPFIGDSSSFFYVQFKLYFDSLVTSKADVIWRRFIEDPKNPLSYLHYLLFPRTFLLSMNSHLVYTGATFAVFSALLGWAVYKRTGSTLYAAVAPFLIFSAEGLFHPIYQLPSKLADPPAAFIFGAAVLCLVISDDARSLKWLAGFGLFAGLTLLSRFTASGYLFCVCAPVLAFYLLRRLRDPAYGWRHVAWAVLAIAIPLVAVGGWHFTTHVREVLFFYSVAGSSLNQTFASAFELTLLKFLVNFAGGLGIAVLILVCGSYAVMFWPPPRGISDFLVTAWLAIGVPLVIVGVLRVEDDSPQLAFGLAGYLLFALTPFSIAALPEKERRGATRHALVVAIALVPATMFALAIRPYRSYVFNIEPQELSVTAANRKMAEYAATRQREQGREQAIDAGFDYQWRHLQPTALYRFGSLLRTDRQFEIRKEQWWLKYRDRTPQEIARLLAADYDANTDILYFLADPAAPEARNVVKDDFTIAVAEGVIDWLRSSPNWSKLGDVPSPWGAVEVWANRKRQ